MNREEEVDMKRRARVEKEEEGYGKERRRGKEGERGENNEKEEMGKKVKGKIKG